MEGDARGQEGISYLVDEGVDCGKITAIRGKGKDNARAAARRQIFISTRIPSESSLAEAAETAKKKEGHRMILDITKPSRASFLHDVQKRSIVSSSEALLRVGKQCFVFEDHASLLKTPPHIITTPGQL